jgi:hypothetical protein
MAHGYLGDGYGSHVEIDPDRDDDRDRGSRDRNWRDNDDHWRNRDRDRGMMFGDSDRSNQDRWDDHSREREGRDREHGFGGYRENRGGWDQDSGSYGANRRFSANPHDHYRSWRERHMSELDNDYQDYCREREQQFHRDFDQWRREKYGNPQPLRTGMTQTGISHDPTGETQAAEDMAPDEPRESNPTATATLGTNSGRSRSRG